MAPKLPKRTRDLIGKAIDTLYGKIRHRFLGPDVSREGKIYFSHTPEITLPGMFSASSLEEGMKPNSDTLQALMEVAKGYLDANQSRTKARVIKEVSSALEDAHRSGVDTDLETILNSKLIDVFGEAQTNIETIVNTETNAAKNFGLLDGINAVNAAAGIEDPSVAFIVTHRMGPDAPCAECVRLHCTNGLGSPPRVWKLSECTAGYHKKGENFPSITGEHPNCNCTMITILPGYGYQGSDQIKFIEIDHDEYKEQRG